MLAALRLRACRGQREIDRNDGAYATPHWAGQFVLLVGESMPNGLPIVKAA